MKSLILFAVILLPLGTALWFLGAKGESTARLPAEGTVPAQPPVLEGSDLADAYGRTPFGGRIRRLDGLELRVMVKGRVQYYVRFGRLARHAGHPHLEEVVCALFDPPENGRPKLLMTFAAPTVTGDPAALANPDAGAPKALDLAGGVTVRDARGREMLAVPRLHLDFSAKTATSDDRVVIRIPGHEATIRGSGLHVDIDTKRAVLRRQVEAVAPAGGGTLTIACEGPATIEDLEDGNRLRIVLSDAVSVVHPLARARCPRLVAELIRAKGGRYELVRTALEGGVVWTLDPKAAHGIERIEVSRLVLKGKKTITCEGPVKALWQGVLAPLGLGRHRIEITAGTVTALLKKTAQGKPALDEIHFAGGFRAQDREGAGGAWAKSLAFFADQTLLVMEGVAGVKTPEGSLDANRIEARSAGKDSFCVLVTGLERFSYVADGKLGPLGKRRRGTLRLTCKGPLRVEGRPGERISFHAQEEVVAWVDTESRMEAGTLAVELESGRLARVDARGGIFLRGRGAEIRGLSLSYAEKTATIAGSPATIHLDSGRSVAALRIRYLENRSFLAEGKVTVRAVLGQGEGRGSWTVTCRRAHGLLARDGSPRSLVAEGSVRALGPKGEVVAGDRCTYDGETGHATLTGKPARIERAKDLVIAAPVFDLRMKKGRIQEAHSRGGTSLDLVQKKGFRRWHVKVLGPADFLEERLVLPQGAQLEAFDKQGKRLLRARAARVQILLEMVEKKPVARQLLATGGVEIVSGGQHPATVSAERLRYEVGSRRVDMFGKARVMAQGWPRDVRFRHVVFVLTDKGIDLERASEIEVRPSPR